jgi:hypothetical protein
LFCFSVFLLRSLTTDQASVIHCAVMLGMPRLQQGGFWVIKAKIADSSGGQVYVVKRCCVTGIVHHFISMLPGCGKCKTNKSFCFVQQK